MANEVSIKTVGDWEAKIGVGLSDALKVSMDIMGRTGEEACRHALILMAQSSRAMAKQAPKNRPVTENPKFRHLLRKSQYKTARMAGNRMADYYKLTADKLMQPPQSLKLIYANSRPPIARIGHRGLAKRSWLWGLASIGGPAIGNELAGASAVYSILGQQACGYVKENRISYIQKAMPSGWQTLVEQKAVNKMMAQARNKMTRQWQSALRRNEKAVGRTLASFFKAAAA